MMLWLLAGLVGCAPCGGDGAMCPVASGKYAAWAPRRAGEPLPVLLFFHGYNGDPGTIASTATLDALDEEGMLLIAPEGIDQSWNLWSQPEERDEAAFVADVLADVRQRWAVDDSRIYISGFSIGGSMANILACAHGDTYAATAPFSGTFWEPMPEACDAPPMPLRHVHGTEDTTWPMAGRAFSADMAQGAVEDGVAVWRAHNGCTETSTQVTEGTLTCTVWSDCTGEAVRLCLHDGGHIRPSGWAADLLDWLRPHQRR